MEIRVLLNLKTANLRTLKWWGGDMAADGYTSGGIDQFAFIRTYQINAAGNYIGDMSANNTGATITHSDLMKIAALQTPDENTLDQKMEWLTWSGVDSWGAPMRIPGGGNWIDAPSIRMIGAVWAGNLVEVLEQRTFKVTYNGIKADVPMSRIRTFNIATDWGKTFATHPQLIHNVLAVGKTDLPHKPKGTVYLPLIFEQPSVWVFDRWLSPK